MQTENIPEVQTYTAKDFASDQEVRWCPGCGDYSILKQVQTVLAELKVEPHNITFISGIGRAPS
jgi:2-oxoglutarate ferredoxin oxidoreductase subunit beta